MKVILMRMHIIDFPQTKKDKNIDIIKTRVVIIFNLASIQLGST